LILRPLVGQLSVENGRDKAIEYCQRLLYLCQQAGLIPGYCGGNIIDLLIALDVDLQHHNFTNLYIAEVDFQATTLQLWDFSNIAPGKLPTAIDIPAHRGMATALAFSLNGKLIASTGSDRAIKLWDAVTGKYLQTLSGHTDYVQHLIKISNSVASKA